MNEKKKKKEHVFVSSTHNQLRGASNCKQFTRSTEIVGVKRSDGGRTSVIKYSCLLYAGMNKVVEVIVNYTPRFERKKKEMGIRKFSQFCYPDDNYEICVGWFQMSLV